VDENTDQQAQNQDGAEDSNVSTSPVGEQNTSEESQQQQGEQQQTTEQQGDDSERRPNRAERRIHQLNDKLKQTQQPYQQPAYGQSPQMPQYQAGEEVTPERLQADVVQTAQAIANATVNQQLSQFQAQSTVQQDISSLPSTFDELNPSKADTYVPELEAAIAQEFEERAFRVVGYNPQTGEPIKQLDPSVRLADIAKRHVDTARAIAKRTSTDMRNAVARTADETAVRPNGASSREEKPFGDLSIAEMEKRLGFAQQ